MEKQFFGFLNFFFIFHPIKSFSWNLGVRIKAESLQMGLMLQIMNNSDEQPQEKP